MHANRPALDNVGADLEEIAGTPIHRKPWYLEAAKASQAKLHEPPPKQEPAARPLCGVVRSAGFAPMNSLLDDIGKKGLKRLVILGWSGRNQHEHYLLLALERWQKLPPSSPFLPVITEIRGFAGPPRRLRQPSGWAMVQARDSTPGGGP